MAEKLSFRSEGDIEAFTIRNLEILDNLKGQIDKMNTYTALLNNLEVLKLHQIKENLDTYIDLITNKENSSRCII